MRILYVYRLSPCMCVLSHSASEWQIGFRVKCRIYTVHRSKMTTWKIDRLQNRYFIFKTYCLRVIFFFFVVFVIVAAVVCYCCCHNSHYTSINYVHGALVPDCWLSFFFCLPFAFILVIIFIEWGKSCFCCSFVAFWIKNRYKLNNKLFALYLYFSIEFQFGTTLIID